MSSRLSLAGLALRRAPLSLADIVATSPDGAFSIHDAVPAAAKAGLPWIRPDVFKPMTVDWPKLLATLGRAPAESAPGAWKNAIVVSLPMPDGTFSRFQVVDSPVMEPALAAEFPNIKSFLGQGIDDPAATVRFDYTPLGFHAQILSPNGAVYIDPYSRNDTRHYVVYYKRDYKKAADGWQCLTMGEAARPPRPQGGADSSSGTNLRTFRLACACTGEYAAFFGGTVPNAQAAIVTAINRVTGVYEIDCSVRMVLVANNTNVVFTNAATDPYTNNNGGTMLGQNQTTCDNVALIGSANYDIGHVFSTGGGGIAGLGVVGIGGQKAQGVTGSPSPTGDPFYIDYVAHEMGHQFSANHCFNGTAGSCGGGNRSASHAYEPGSGSTIMSYAGICGSDDYQAHSDVAFGADGHDAVVSWVTSSIPGVGTTVATGNALPVVNAGADFTIPQNTPFTLVGSATDPNGPNLTYSWEQRDLGAAAALGTAGLTTGPLFRPFTPSTANIARTLPRLSNLLANISDTDEVMPTVNRTVRFRLCVRDNRAGGGGYGDDEMLITVSGSPFSVTSPNTNVSWSAVQTVTWNVGGGSVAPNVAILLSTDGGNTFPTTLVASTPNDGSESVLLPNISTSLARIKVAAVGSIFFDISNTNFTITPGSACPSFTQQPNPQLTCDGAPIQFQVTAIGAPAPTYQWKKDNSTLVNGGNISGATTSSLTIDPASGADEGVYTCVASNSCGNLTSDGATLTVESPPGISQQPVPQSVPLGSPATFSVTASFATGYTWRKNNVTIPGANSSSYTINSVQLSDVANYSCFITGNCGFRSSSQAALTIASACYPNCDQSTTPPILNVQDFACFLNMFAGGDTYANCDGSTTPPTLNVQDFACFLNAFAAGCS